MDTNEIHKNYLQRVCRVCGEDSDKKKYKLENVLEIISLAFEDSDLSTDTELTESKVVCRPCYQSLKRWNEDHQKTLLYNRRNPQSHRDLSNKQKIPERLAGPIVHHAGCACGAGGEGDLSDQAEAGYNCGWLYSILTFQI